MVTDCYSVIVCSTAICDKSSGLITYVSCHEQWTVPAEMLGNLLGVQAHFALEGSGVHEIRAMWVAADGSTVPAGDVVDTITIDKKQRFCSPQLRLPPKPGAYDLVLEMRTVAKAWRRCTARAPILIKVMDVATPSRLDS